MVLNEQDVLVDFHPLGPLEGDHLIITGVIDQSMPIGQERAVIRTGKDETVSFFVRPQESDSLLAACHATLICSSVCRETRVVVAGKTSIVISIHVKS